MMKAASILFLVCLVFSLGCRSQVKPPVDRASVDPGSSVSFRGNKLALLGAPVAVGKPLPSVLLVDAMTMKEVDLSKEPGKVLFLSIVPSIDTKVCEAQTHYLGEEGDRLPGEVRRIAISRDLPFAQSRFAEEAKLTDIQYLSDYKAGEFGLATGLLVDDLKLLARSVVLVDKKGIVRHIQVVPEVAHLPDMDGAFLKAERLAKEQ
jgi:thioredoxin-dependent peroxiredoxin